MYNGSDLSVLWLKNIKNLDSKNHLVHGEIYSKDGSILDFEITGNSVKANVEGAPGDIFDVEIVFRQMSATDRKFITDYIFSSYFLFSELLNDNIPEELFDTKVKLLPDSLKDFKMSCNCNRGLFCKHKAAVFHKIADKIARDPFLVFSLSGFDLEKIVNDGSNVIKTVKNIVKKEKLVNFDDCAENTSLIDSKFILSDYPQFYNSNSINFNEILQDTLASMSRAILHIINPVSKKTFNEYVILGNTLKSFEYFSSKSPDEIKFEFENKWSKPQNWKDFKITIDGNYEIIQIRTGKHANNFTNRFKDLLFGFFAEMNQINCPEYSPRIKYLHEVYLFTAKLIRQNELIPEFFKLDNSKYHIRWIPDFKKHIYDELEKLILKCPDDLILFCDTHLSRYNQVIILISLFFEGFSSYYVSRMISHKLSSSKNETYFRLFFINSQYFNTYNYKGKEYLVNNWLLPLFLKENDFKFSLDISQTRNEFIFDINIMLDGCDVKIDDIVSKKRYDIVKNISVIYEIFSKFNIDFNSNQRLIMDLRQFTSFADNIAPVFEELGVEVIFPQEFEKAENVHLLLVNNSKSADASLTIDDLNDFDWRVAIGDELYKIEDFKTFSANYRGLINIKDKYMVIDDNDLLRLKRQMEFIPQNPTKSELLRFLLSGRSDEFDIDDRLVKLMDSVLEIHDVSVPSSLNGQLRRYQETGFSWMLQNMKVGFGSILADDMGLGKTIQMIAVTLYLKEHGFLKEEKVLIIVPTSIITNWFKEIEKFAPSINVEIYHGPDRHFPENDFDILLTSYGMVRSDKKLLRQKDWFLLVIDEAQNIKNPKSKQTLAIKSIRAKNYVALSGTPIENYLSEYWSIFDFINRGYLLTLKEFKNRFMKPIEKDRNQEVLEDFKKITSPFILRRHKSDKDIIKDLPEKVINDVYCNLTLKQASLYDETLNALIRDVEDSEGIERKGRVLKLINSLKQICNHPSHYLKRDEFEIDESGKMQVLMNILENIIDLNESVLIFSQYVQMGKIIKKLAEEKFSQEVLFLHGSVSRQKRDEMIERFQNGEVNIFILSLKAGGIGLNLTAATNVIHYDLWWNPAVENQATDRAYRIGQKDNVMVYRFITTGTLEERINQILLDKRELAEITIEGNEKFITEMSNEDLKEMLKLRD